MAERAPRVLCGFGGVLGLLLLPFSTETVLAQPAEPPPPLPERPLAFPSFHETRLPNGLELVVLEHRNQPVANARLYLPSGSARDPEGGEGLAAMAADVLTKGTETRSAREIAETIEGVGGSLDASATRDFLTVSVSGLAEHLPLGMELLADVVLHPTFPAEEVELTRRRTLSSLQAARGQPQQLAVRRFFPEIFGAEHPYGRTSEPTSVQALTRDDLLRFHESELRPNVALLVVAGDVDPAEVEELAGRHLGSWEPAEVSAPAFPPPPRRDRVGISFVHRPGSVQSTVLMGHVGPEPDHPDFITLEVVNRILGGGADSRLFRILREERGWTYDAFSQAGRLADVGFLLAFAEVRNEVTDSTIVEMLHQIRRLRDEPVPPDEVEAAISYLAGSFPLTIETASQIAARIAENRLLGLPPEWMRGYRERIRAVTPEDVQRVAREQYDPDRLAIVVVGDAGQVLTDLEEIAEVALYDVEGAPVAREDVLPSGTPIRDGTRLVPMVRTYDVILEGEPAGSMTYTLEREGEVWVARANMASAGIEQDQVLRFGARDLEALSLEQESSRGGTALSANLRVERGRLVGEAELSADVGGSRSFDEELPPGVVLPGMDEYVLAASDLESGAEITLTTFDLLAGTVAAVTFEVVAEETVEVGAGVFETYRVESRTGPAAIIFHLRKEAPHILVRQEYEGMPFAVELRSLR